MYRHKIILDIGSALMYLHQEWDQCVVHRDIKPSNVMLDSSFNAKLGDFGLARLVDHSRDAHTTAVIAGTRGYMDPMYAVTRRASTETDVYSFGVVLLGVACGRRPVIQEEDEARAVLVDWVWQLYGRGKLLDAADARIDGEFDAREVERVMVVGLWCVHPDYGCRPSIRQAMSVLQLEAPLPDLPPDMPVAIYVPPGGGHGSSYTSLNASYDTGGLSLASDRTAKSCSSAVAGTRSENDVTNVMNQAAGTTEHVQLRNYTS
jgi:serine/threonine protein kinase